jgi:membrane associated rhomboid family serine protease
VNITLIVLNIAVFAYELTLSTAPGIFGSASDLDRFFYEWGAIPACLGARFGFSPDVSQADLVIVCPSDSRVVWTPLTSMFIHGGWLHIGGNLLFLWVFGDNVEDAMGHVRYAVFYVLGGFAATAAHIAVSQNDLIPAIGASGAISAVMGAYIVMFPRATVAAILPIFIFFFLPINIPAVVLIGIWFLLQLFNGVASFTGDVVGAGGGVAWFAHIGGFVAGVVLVKLFVLGREVPPPRSQRYARRYPFD